MPQKYTVSKTKPGNLYKAQRKLTFEKYNHLQQIRKSINSVYWHYYDTLPHHSLPVAKVAEAEKVSVKVATAKKVPAKRVAKAKKVAVKIGMAKKVPEKKIAEAKKVPEKKVAAAKRVREKVATTEKVLAAKKREAADVAQGDVSKKMKIA